MPFIYFFIALLATMAGALTGMGGGVIIKPVLDLLGGYDAATVNVMASVAVFFMTVVSIGRQMLKKARIDFSFAIPLAIGSVAGGNLGQLLLSRLIAGMSGRLIIVLQNAILAALVVIIFLYMLVKGRLRSPGWRGIPAALLAGLILGLLSSFLGIGGGPFNVALLIFLFAVDTKSAVLYSLITIFFAQSAKLVSIMAGGGFGGYDLSLLPPLVIGAVAGGLVGSALGGRLSEKAVEKAFNGIQVVVFLFCILNIVRNW